MDGVSIKVQGLSLAQSLKEALVGLELYSSFLPSYSSFFVFPFFLLCSFVCVLSYLFSSCFLRVMNASLTVNDCGHDYNWVHLGLSPGKMDNIVLKMFYHRV